MYLVKSTQFQNYSNAKKGQNPKRDRLLANFQTIFGFTVKRFYSSMVPSPHKELGSSLLLLCLFGKYLSLVKVSSPFVRTVYIYPWKGHISVPRLWCLSDPCWAFVFNIRVQCVCPWARLGPHWSNRRPVAGGATHAVHPSTTFHEKQFDHYNQSVVMTSLIGDNSRWKELTSRSVRTVTILAPWLEETGKPTYNLPSLDNFYHLLFFITW